MKFIHDITASKVTEVEFDDTLSMAQVVWELEPHVVDAIAPAFGHFAGDCANEGCEATHCQCFPGGYEPALVAGDRFFRTADEWTLVRARFM